MTTYLLFHIIQKLIEKENILILLTASYGGGAERIILDQIFFFDKNKFNLQVITIREGNIEETFRNQHFAPYLCLKAPKKSFIHSISILNKYIKEHRIDLLHVHLIEPELFSIPLKILNPKLKIIVTKHLANDIRKKFYFSLVLKFISIFIDKMICVSEDRANFACKYETLNPSKVIILYNGTNTEKFQRISDTKKISGLRKDFGLKDDDYIIGIIGRIIKHKGHGYLIDVVRTLKSKIPVLKILVVGDGPYENILKEKIHEQSLDDYFVFPGYQNNLVAIYSILDILCIPSINEGLSTVLLEGMSSQTLAIIADLPSNREIAVDGKEAVYFCPGNHLELAEKIYFSYQNPDIALLIKENARKKIVEK
ncbi:glycosyltransferase, partial [bacterium]|nr:glycosyltransferase [bacterium]